MSDPVVAGDGYTYDRNAIEEWFDMGHATSPMTNEVLDDKRLVSNRALRSEILSGRVMVDFSPDDILELATALAPPPASAPTAFLPTPAAPGLAAPGSAQPLSMPPQYEEIRLVIPNLLDRVHELSREVAPQGWSYRRADAVDNYAVAVFARRLTAAEARGAARYERFSTVMVNRLDKIFAVGEEMRKGGWSFVGLENDNNMLKVNFKRRCAAEVPRDEDLMTCRVLLANLRTALEENADAMRAAGWSYDGFRSWGNMVVVRYKHARGRPEERGPTVYEKMSYPCRNNIDAIARTAAGYAENGWSFDRWEIAGQSVTLHFQRPLHADGTPDIVAPPHPRTAAAAPTRSAPQPAPAPQPVPAPRYRGLLGRLVRR